MNTLPECLLLTKIAPHLSPRPLILLGLVNKEFSIHIKPLITEHFSARRIQRFWRWCRWFSSNEMVAKRFMRTNLPADGFMAYRPFNLETHIHQKPVRQATLQFLNRVNSLQLLVYSEHHDDDRVGSKKKYRVDAFLDAYVLINPIHNSYYYSNIGTGFYGNQILGAARGLITCVDSMLIHFMAPLKKKHLDIIIIIKRYHCSMEWYMDCHEGWKDECRVRRAALRKKYC